VEFEAEIPADMRMPTAITWLIVGLASLLYGAQLLVDGSVAIARAFGISEVVIGITLVAIGTSLPEFAVTVVSALRREYDIAIGNIVGSNIFNLLAVIGVAAVIEPASLHPSVLSLHIFVMVAFTLALFAITYETRGKGRIKRIEGVVLVTSYVAYIAYVVAQSV
ncbi:MAG TPA: calcium/sodium antiporter, partial [Woeseiaceae bacterium]|nr:calcium/sodium antiporter [Woeseiaceae bacterium]